MRTALVDAALTVLQRDGAAALTVRNITAQAGCSTTGVYTYFRGKNGLVEAIFVEGFESFDRAVKPLLEADDIVGAGRAYRQWALANPTQYMVMFGRAVPDFTPSDPARGRALESFYDLAEAIRRANSSIDFGERAFHVFATVHGYVMLELSGMGAQTREESDHLYERALSALAETW
jgi:AcrR family transcriptional regulator